MDPQSPASRVGTTAPTAYQPWRDAASRQAGRSRRLTTRPREDFNRALALLERGDFSAGWPLDQLRVPSSRLGGVGGAPVHRAAPRSYVAAGRRCRRTQHRGVHRAGARRQHHVRTLPAAAHSARRAGDCSPTLRPIFEHVDGIHALLSPPPEHPGGKLNQSALHFDAFAPLLSLPYVLGTTQETIPADIPYLRADPVRVAAWQERYEAQGRTGRRRVGVVFQANLAGRSAPKKLMRIGDMVPLAAIEGIDLVNLQHGPEGRAFAAAVPAVIDATAEPMPLDEYAAAIAATDILISVDTMVAHGAGAMGRPVWVALPMAPGWHWGRARGVPLVSVGLSVPPNKRLSAWRM